MRGIFLRVLRSARVNIVPPMLDNILLLNTTIFGRASEKRLGAFKQSSTLPHTYRTAQSCTSGTGTGTYSSNSLAPVSIIPPVLHTLLHFHFCRITKTSDVQEIGSTGK